MQKKTEKITKKIFGRLSEPMFTTFWSYKVDMLICFLFFFDVSFFKYNTDGIWVWKCQTRCKYDYRYLFFVSKNCKFFVSKNCKFFVSTVILSSCNLNCIQKTKQKTKKKLTCSKYKHHIEWAFKQTCCILFQKFCPLTNLSLPVPNKH